MAGVILGSDRRKILPSRELFNAFIADVLSNDHVGALERWYAPEASMQENQSEPRLGRDRLISEETAVLAQVASVRSELVGEPLLEGNRAAIRWRFTFTRADGSFMTMEEVAWQEWDGDQIVREQFFYDPAQRRFVASSDEGRSS